MTNVTTIYFRRSHRRSPLVAAWRRDSHGRLQINWTALRYIQPLVAA